MKNLLKIQNLFYKYPDGHEALKKINLEIKIDTGEKTALVGANGSGKSTKNNTSNNSLFEVKIKLYLEFMKNLSIIKNHKKYR